MHEKQQKQDTSTNTAGSTPKSADQKIQQILDKHATVFQGEVKLRGQEIKLHIRTDVEPIIQPQRRIPYHMRKQATKEPKPLVKEDIIEPVSDQPTPWISPIVCTPEKVKDMIDKCIACQAIGQSNSLEPVKLTPTDNIP